MDESFRLHHIGILVADVERAASLMISRFGYIAEGGLVEDTQQTAYARFLRLPGADHWTELVAPNGPASKLQGAIERRRGGTHHVCYEVPDIQDACERLRESGMSLVSPPVPGIAYGDRKIAWLMDRDYLLVELLEAGPGPLGRPTR